MNVAMALFMLMQCCSQESDGSLHGDYPKIGMYSQLRSNGLPFRIDENPANAIDYDAIATQAKWNWIVIDMVGDPGGTPSNDNRVIMQAMRTAAPAATISAFTQGQTLFACKQGWWWDHGGGFDWNDNGIPDDNPADPTFPNDVYFPAGCDTTGTNFLWTRMKIARAHNAVLYSLTRDRNNDGKKDAFTRNECSGGSCVGETFGHPIDSPFIDFAMPGVGQALADTIVDWAQRLEGVYNGIFVDELCRQIGFWQGANTDSIDYTRSGAASLAAWNTAYQAGVNAFLERILSQVPDGWIVADNGCAISGSDNINGHMRENFPNQNGGTWTSNMLGTGSGVAGDVGYLGDDDRYADPIHTTLLMLRVTEGTTNPLLAQDHLTAQRLHRLILASATLGEGYGLITGTTNDISRGYLPWWADEFSVTPAGVSSQSKAYQGWLGDPISEWYVDAGGGYRRDFYGGAVIVNNQGPPVTGPTRTFSFNPGYYRILGSVCPSVNTGAAVTAPITLQPRDALFLQKRPPSGTP
jgi:hypothetical protein